MKKTLLSLVCVLSLLLSVLSCGLFAFAEDDNKIVITECDSLDGWTSTMGGNALELRHGVTGVEKTAVGANVGVGKWAGRVYTASEALDISAAATLEWDMMFLGDGGADLWALVQEHYATKMLLTLTDDAGKTMTFALDKMTATPYESSNWVHFAVDLADSTSKDEGFALTALKSFNVNTTTENNAAVPGGNIRVDSIYAILAEVETEPETPAGPVVITECDSLDGWSSNGGNALEMKHGVTGEANSAIGANIGAAKWGGRLYTAPAALDISGCATVEWDMVFMAGVTFDDVKEYYADQMHMTLTDEAGKTIVFKLDKMTVTEVTDSSWLHFAVSLADSSSMDEGFDAAKVKTFIVETCTAANSAAPGGHIRIDAVYAIPAPVVPAEDVVIADCNSLDGWSSNGGNALEMKHGVTGEANSAIGANIGAAKWGGRLYTAPAALDISACATVEWDMVFMAGVTFDDVKEYYADQMHMTLTDEAGKTIVFKLDKMTVTEVTDSAWLHFAVSLADSSSMDEGFDAAKVKTFIVETCTAANSAAPGGHIRIDEIVAKVPAGGEGEEPGEGEDPGEGEEPVDPDTLPSNKENPEGELWLSDGDNNKGWHATGANGEDVLVVDEENKTEGTASVGGFAQGGVLKEIVYKPAAPIDVTGYKYLEFDIYFSNLDFFSKATGFMFEITSSGKCDWESNRYMKGRLQDVCPAFKADVEAGGISEGKWYSVKFEVTNPQAQANGGLDVTALDYFRYYSVAPYEPAEDYEVRIDNIRFTNNEDAPAGDDKPGDEKPDDEKPGDDKPADGNKPADKDESPATGDTAVFAVFAAVVALMAAAVLLVSRKSRA